MSAEILGRVSHTPCHMITTNKRRCEVDEMQGRYSEQGAVCSAQYAGLKMQQRSFATAARNERGCSWVALSCEYRLI